jgi:hypothetical protein
MDEPIMTAAEWMRRPKWHGSYDDYVRHVRGVREWLAREAEDRLADKIATKLAAKLKSA